MNLTFITASVSRNAGGLYESVRCLARALQTGGARVNVLGVEDQYTREDIDAWRPVNVTTCSVVGPKRFNFAPYLSHALRRTSTDILFAHAIWNYTSVVVNKWHRETGKPYIIHPHGMLDSWAVRHSGIKKYLAAQLYEKEHLRNAACIRALCESEANSIRAYGVMNPICVIPNGINLPEIDDRMISNGPLDPIKKAGGRILFFLGRIHPKKGLVNLVRAWASMQDEPARTRGSWALAIAGWDEKGHEAELKRLATECGIPWADTRESDLQKDSRASQSSLFFIGPQFHEAKIAGYHQSDAFILPSFSEGLPMAVLEAWSHGKAVLMTPECNLPEGFAAGAALRIETSAGSIRRGLLGLLEMSESERRGIGAAGIQLVKERFSWRQIASDMRAVSEYVLNGGGRPACYRSE